MFVSTPLNSICALTLDLILLASQATSVLMRWPETICFLGHTVVAESVNPIQATREAWQLVATETGVPALEIEVVCSDLEQHKARYLARVADIEGLEYGPWEDVLTREYEDWATRDLQIDTANSTMAQSCAELMQKLQNISL